MMAINRLKTRNKIEDRYKWVLEDIYLSLDKWEHDFDSVKKDLDRFAGFSGKLPGEPSILPAVLQEYSLIMKKTEKLFVYAHLKRDEDNSDQASQALMDRARTLLVEAESICSFLIPDILKIDAGELKRLLAGDKRLSDYTHYLRDVIRRKKHTLSAENERILAMAGDMAASSQLIFGMIDNADISFPAIKDEEGNKVELTKGRYAKFMESKARKVRRHAFNSLYTTYGKQKNTLSAALSSSVKKDLFYSRARKYNTSLEAALFDDNVPVSVYDNLIASVSSRLDPLHKYMGLRKKALQLDRLHMYDLYVPIVDDVEFKVSYEEAKEMVLASLGPLGDEYVSVLGKGLAGGWIDVFENKGKTSGAFSWGCYDTHPYVLLNYEGIIDHVFTLTHEMGHAMHTYFSNRTQPYIKAGYKIFVAEVASILNEILLTRYLLDTLEDEKKKQYILNHYLEQFRGTVYRQTMFAEFEKIIHDHAEKQVPLTVESLSVIYHDLNVKYYGSNVDAGSLIDLEWARIPHFYSAFYVYKYALGFSAAAVLSEGIVKKEKNAVDRYLKFLSSGGSDYPVELLKKAGVNMSTPGPVERALDIFGSLVDEMTASLGL
jgi:oligoendopeptidase F